MNHRARMTVDTVERMDLALLRVVADHLEPLGLEVRWSDHQDDDEHPEGSAWVVVQDPDDPDAEDGYADLADGRGLSMLDAVGFADRQAQYLLAQVRPGELLPVRGAPGFEADVRGLRERLGFEAEAAARLVRWGRQQDTFGARVREDVRLAVMSRSDERAAQLVWSALVRTRVEEDALAVRAMAQDAEADGVPAPAVVARARAAALARGLTADHGENIAAGVLNAPGW